MEATEFLTRQHREIEQALRDALAAGEKVQARGKPRKAVHAQTDAAQPLR